ncbi:MAG: bifunctional precorrin-2 dehydrogenase/sirohydrochlorin ferrochelatase, partial [Acidimicrobiales bacterium]|nr:bifunctional precorrin-2 dehydrogenase/sirohydrochlorin ferrochelatase [Acidimicrobiales bacterium]
GGQARMSISGPVFPVNLIVDGKDCLVVGDDQIAERKAEALRACGAKVTVLPAAQFNDGDCAGRWFVVTAADEATNTRVSADAERHGVWVNAADDPKRCTAILPAVLRRGAVTVTVGTAGRSPAMATFLRNKIDEALGPDVATLVEVVAQVRDEMRANGVPTEGLPWQEAFDPEFLELVAVGKVEQASERLRECLLSS